VSDLAREMGIRPSLISKWMLGQTTPSLKNLQKLSAALSLDEDAVLSLVGMRQEQPDDDPRVLHLMTQIRAIEWTDDRYAIIRAALEEMRRRPRPGQGPASSWPRPQELSDAPRSQRKLKLESKD
jgi:transcriptional regulator with XRE-family HTH domain